MALKIQVAIGIQRTTPPPVPPERLPLDGGDTATPPDFTDFKDGGDSADPDFTGTPVDGGGAQ